MLLLTTGSNFGDLSKPCDQFGKDKLNFILSLCYIVCICVGLVGSCAGTYNIADSLCDSGLSNRLPGRFAWDLNAIFHWQC